jgi:DNA-directed RNA polymerase subunit alpha
MSIPGLTFVRLWSSTPSNAGSPSGHPLGTQEQEFVLMVLEFQSLDTLELPGEEEEVVPSPTISVLEADDRYGRFAIEPLEPGYGVTLGNPLRRVLYSSLPGTAVTWVKIDGVLHEYATIPHVKEEVAEILLSVKGIRLKSEVERPGKLRLEVAGEGDVSAGDIMATSDFEVVNPEMHLATLDSAEAKLSIEFNVEQGKGYVVAGNRDGLPIGTLPVDAVYTPILKVNYSIEMTRVGRRADFERLVLDVWTDGSMAPVEAVRQAATILINQFFFFANVQTLIEEGADGAPVALRMPAEKYNVAVEGLELSSRTLNCLKRAGIDKVGEVLELSKAELLKIRNFGEKSYNELFGQLRSKDLLPEDLDPENQVTVEDDASDMQDEAEPIAADVDDESTDEDE